MGVNFVKKRLSDFCSESSLRYDYKYITSFVTNSADFYNYRNLFDFVPYEKVDIEELDTFKYAEIGNVNKLGEVEPVELSFATRDEENESLFKKIEKGDIINPRKGDILISKIRPYLNKNVLVTSNDEYYTKAFIHIRPKINSELFYLALRSKFISQINAVSRQGKGYPTLKEDDIKSIRFPKYIVDALINDEAKPIEKITPIKNEINTLKVSKKLTGSIINQVFGEAFGFDWEAFESIKQEKLYTSNLASFANNIDCRFSYRFQHKSATYLHNFLENITNKRVKHFLDIPIVLGSSISPKQFDEEGEYYYVSMATVKNYCFEKDDAQTVSGEYARNNLEKSVKLNDIIMTRSGVAIGKFALIDEDINGIFADFTMRIRLKGFNSELAYYYFRSEFFQHLITSHKKGLQNQNIFPSQIKEFPMPDWNEIQQAEIVEAIKTQLDAQKTIDRQIEEKQQAINKIIEDTIKQEQN